jgi:hypothetical protein
MWPPRWLVELMGLVVAAVVLAFAASGVVRQIAFRPWPWITGLLFGVLALATFWGLSRLTPALLALATKRPPAAALLLVSACLTFGIYGYTLVYFKQDEPEDAPTVMFTAARPALVSATYEVSDCGKPVTVSLGVILRPPARRANEPVTVAIALGSQGDAEPIEGKGQTRWLLPDPHQGLKDPRSVGLFEANPVQLERHGGDSLEGEIRDPASRAVLHFSAKWLHRRDDTSCELAIPRIAGMEHVWSAVRADGTVDLAEFESIPTPLVDRNGVSLWECAPGSDTEAEVNLPGQCVADAAFVERDQDFERNLNLILIGAGLSLGLTLLVEGFLALFGAPSSRAAR